MRRTRSIHFDHLEERKLLTTAHHAVAHKAVAHKVVAHKAAPVVLTPLTINGTFTVNNKAATQSTDDMGDTTTATSVVGTLNGLTTHGVWDESVDSFGDYLGPDTLTLQNSQGTLIVGFNDGSPGKLQKPASGADYYQLTQKFEGGSNTYAKHSETGTIDLYTNKARSAITSLSLSTTSK